MIQPSLHGCQKLLYSNKLITFLLSVQLTVSIASSPNTTLENVELRWDSFKGFDSIKSSTVGGNLTALNKTTTHERNASGINVTSPVVANVRIETPNQVPSKVLASMDDPEFVISISNSSIKQEDLSSDKTKNMVVFPLIILHKNLTSDHENAKIEINKELTMKVLNEFDKITINLQELAKELRKDKVKIVKNYHTLLSRAVRSSSNPLGRRQQCSVSKDKLTALKNSINNALANSHTTNQNINCDLANDDKDNCEDLVLLIQCGVDHLKNGFQRAIGQTTSLDELTKWKNELFSLQNAYQTHIDSVKQSVSQDYRQKIDNLETNLQTTTQIVNHLLKDLKQKTKSLCIAEIGNGKITRAIEHCKELVNNSDTEELGEIIQTAYVDKKLDNVKNIVDFLSDLYSTSYQCFVEGFKSLYKEMEKYGHLGSPEVLLLANEVVKRSCYPSDLKDKCKLLSNNVLEAWSKRIQSGDYQQVKEFSKKYPSGIMPSLGVLVEKAYDNDINKAEVVLKFIRDLPFIDQSGEALSSLYKAMDKGNHLYGHQVVMLAYSNKEHMEMPNYPNIHQTYKDKFVYVKDNLPQAVTRLIWEGDRCKVENYWHDEYLYAEDDYYNHDSDRRKIFTWVPKNNINDRFYWKFGAENSGKTFSIENKHNREYLFASTYLPRDSKRRWVFTWIPGSRVYQDDWRLEYIPQGQSFAIFNTHHNEYLYADGDMDEGEDSERRGVYTWRLGTPQDVMERESRWEIDCGYN